MRRDRVEQRVAVRRRLLHLARAEQGGCARLVLDDHRHAQRLGHALRDRAGLNVGLPARRERHDDANRLSGNWKLLGLRERGKQAESSRKRARDNAVVHRDPPEVTSCCWEEPRSILVPSPWDFSAAVPQTERAPDHRRARAFTAAGRVLAAHDKIPWLRGGVNTECGSYWRLIAVSRSRLGPQ